MGVGGITTLVGFTVLLRCAWAVSQCKALNNRCIRTVVRKFDPEVIVLLGYADRDMLKLTQQEFMGLPQGLQLELLIGTVMCLIGGFIISGSMKPITLSRGAPSMDTGSMRAGFITVNHRGKALPLPVAAVVT